MISSSGAEVDLLQKRQIHYFFKVLFALLPGILILWFIRESMMLLNITTNRLLYKKYKQLFDMAYAENFILVTFHHLILVSFIFLNILNLQSPFNSYSLAYLASWRSW